MPTHKLTSLIMLKLQDLNQHQDLNQVYQSQRNKEVVEIRRIEREQTFKKKRLLLDPADPNAQSTHNNQTNPESNHEISAFAIVDDRFAQQIRTLNQNVYHLSQLQQLISLLQDEEPVSVMCGTIALRKILSSNSSPPIQEVIDAGAVDRLLELIDWTDWPQIQYQSLWCITNILAGTTDQCATVISKSALPRLVQLLRDKTMGVVEQVVWALGNVSSDCINYRNLAIQAGAIDGIVQVVYERNPSPGLIRQSCWALSNLCRGNPLPDYTRVQNAMRVLCAMLATGCIKQLGTYADCCWAISYHCDGLKHRLDPIMESNLLQRLLPLALGTNNLTLLLPSLRVLGQVSTGNPQCVSDVIENGGLDLFEKCVFSNKKMLRRQACWILSNIAASSFQQVSKFLKRQRLVQQLVKMFTNDSEEVKRQLCFIFSNLAHTARNIAIDQLLIGMGAIEGFVRMLESDDDKSILGALDGLTTILRIADIKKKERGLDANLVVIELHSLNGTSLLERLQYNEDDVIYFRVNHILTQYFELSDPTEGRLEEVGEENKKESSGQEESDEEQPQ